MDKQSEKRGPQSSRRQTYIIPKRVFWQRYPMITLWSCTFVALGIFFSRPIYDAFIRDKSEGTYILKQNETRRDAIYKAWKI